MLDGMVGLLNGRNVTVIFKCDFIIVIIIIIRIVIIIIPATLSSSLNLMQQPGLDKD